MAEQPPISLNLTAAGVWVPLHLANSLFHCYYGNGPRFSDRPSPEDASPRQAEAKPDIPPHVTLQTLPPNIRPRGYAARPQPQEGGE
jgi:hypothetical protein